MSEVQGLCPSTVDGAWPPLFGAWAVEEIVGFGGRRVLLQKSLSQGLESVEKKRVFLLSSLKDMG